MSISFNSTNNDFTPAADEEEMKGEVLENKEQSGKNRGTVAERRIGKLERENKELQEKLLQQMMVQLSSLQSKVDKMEEERRQQREREEQSKYVYAEQFKAILEKISDLEGTKQKEEEQQKGMMKAAKNFIVEKCEATNGRMVEIEKRLKTEKGKYVSAGQFEKILDRTEKLEKQFKPFQQQQKQEAKAAKFATVEKLEETFGQVGDMLKQQKQKLEQLDTAQQKLCEKMASMENFVVDLFSQMQNPQQTEIYAKIDEFAHQLKMEIDVMANATKTKVEVLDRQQKKIWDKFSVLDNFIGILKDRFENELLKAVHSDVRQNIAEKFSNPQQNCWEVTACHNELEIFGNESLRIHYKGDGSGFCSVFAKYSVQQQHLFEYYYNKIVKYFKTNFLFCFATIGLATKAMPLNAMVGQHSDSCGYRSDGQLWINDSCNNTQPKFSRGDFVGCGINLATRRVIFTKNGKRLDTADLFLSPSSADPLFPCMSLNDSGDLMEANFGPYFKFDFLAKL
ncbi:hypothetical protein niasHS_015303 [Heterodera schachtii]|uniref:B30.2/SPRY domain-containing protein n=2 Tax=Heterodera TaxID=34509 RepID=A0ABD2I5R3_HETSC